MILGVHCAVLEGFMPALEEARSLDCRAMQMLPYRRHHEPTEADLAAFREARQASRVERLVAHARFVPSLASSDRTRRDRSVELLKKELGYAAGLGAEVYVLHAGAYSPEGDAAGGMLLIAEGVNRAVSESGSTVRVLVENVPGGGRRLGGTLEELAGMLEAGARRGTELGLCIDTAHAWAAGYDLSSAEVMLRFLSRVHRLFGTERVGAFHLSDTRAMLGTHLEHHWHFGEGYIGTEGLKTLLERPEYGETPGIVETPRGEGLYRKSLDFLGRLVL